MATDTCLRCRASPCLTHWHHTIPLIELQLSLSASWHMSSLFYQLSEVAMLQRHPVKSNLLWVYNPKLLTSDLCSYIWTVCCMSISEYIFYLCPSLSLYSLRVKDCLLGFVFASHFYDFISQTELFFFWFWHPPRLLCSQNWLTFKNLVSSIVQSLSFSHYLNHISMMNQKQTLWFAIKPLKFGFNSSL